MNIKVDKKINNNTIPNKHFSKECRIYTKKKRYTTLNGAYEVLKRKGKNYLRIYECDYCNGYHLTHKESV